MSNILIFYTPILEEVDKYTRIIQTIILNNKGKNIFIAECKGKSHLKNCISNYKAEQYKCLICREKFKKITNPNIFKLEYGNANYAPEKFKNIDELKKLTYKEIPIGLGVNSALISILKDYDYDIKKNYQLLNEVINTSKKTIDFLYENKHLNFEDIYVFNGRVSHFNAVVEFSKHFKINYYTFEMSRDKQKFLLNKNALSHNSEFFNQDLLSSWDKTDSVERERIGKLFFSRNFPTNFKYNNYAGNFKKEIPEEIKSLENIFTFFGSSRNEYESIDGWKNDFLTGDDEEIIRDVCEFFKDNNFIYRAHPNLKNKKNTQTENIERLKNIKNLYVIDQYSRISSYELIKISEKIIVFASTIGVEATYLRKPVISLGPSKYDFLDISYKPKNILELKKLLFNKELKPRSKEDALKYGHYLLSRGDFLNKKAFEINLNLKPFHKILIIFLKISNILKNYKLKDFGIYFFSFRDKRIRKQMVNYFLNNNH